jgi:hypothetical protein
MEVSETKNPEIASYAIKRLEKWEDEKHRKAIIS